MKFTNLISFFLNNKKDKKTIILQKIKKASFPKKEVFISVEDFFDGNEDTGSIGANIYPNPPSLQEFNNTLTAIKNNSKTYAILIRIADIEDTDWLYSDMILLAGNYSLSEVKKLFKQLKPDEIYEGNMYNGPSNLPIIDPSVKQYSIWWD